MMKSFLIAFSMYSRIPVPQFAWKEEDMKYMLCFFPWIGAVIGVGILCWASFCRSYEVGSLCYTLIGCLIPLLVTGGFHVDGFMDTMDAFHSYQPKEKKLEILKDAHIGAFAVIRLVCYGLLYVAAFSEIKDERILRILCAGFFLARCLSGISVVSFPLAKQEGMLYLSANQASRTVVKVSLYTQGILCIGFMMGQSIGAGTVMAGASIGTLIYYFHRTKKELGGITGDTAGYFILLCEMVMVVTAGILQM